MLDDASPRGWSFHESFAAYHEPASTRIPLHEDVFTVRTSSRPSRPSAAAAASARLDRISLPPLRHSPAHYPPPPLDLAAEPVRVTRRAMYDPVRDSASSRPPDSPAHALPAAQSPRPQYASEDEDRKPSLACQTCSVPHHGDCIPTNLWRPSHVYEGEDRTVIIRGSSRRQARDRLAAPEPARAAVARPRFTPEELDGLRLPPISIPDISTPEYDHSTVVPELRPKQPRGRHTWEHDRRSSSKRTVTELDGAQDRRSPPCSSQVQPLPYLDIKGKRKMMSSQSPAFRLDNLLEPSCSDASRSSAPPSSAIGGYEQSFHEPPPSESVYARAPSMPVFAGKLPPAPSTLGSAAHTSIGDLGLGITVSMDVNLDKFAIPDDFERNIFTNETPGNLPSIQPGSFASSSRLPVAALNAKAPRKVAPTAPRRKSRGLFPNDDVPLVISSSTTKQSRYRPSGDRQPVACGYKDPITQVQCDEPFNRPVELRRHVRAVHVPAEALAVTMGQLSRSQATLLPNDWKPGDGDVLRPTCVCGKVFSRLDALRRHWTGVNAKVVDGKCIECPSSLAKKKDRYGSDHVLEQGSESIYGTPGYS